MPGFTISSAKYTDIHVPKPNLKHQTVASVPAILPRQTREEARFEGRANTIIQLTRFPVTRESAQRSGQSGAHGPRRTAGNANLEVIPPSGIRGDLPSQRPRGRAPRKGAAGLVGCPGLSGGRTRKMPNSDRIRKTRATGRYVCLRPCPRKWG